MPRQKLNHETVLHATDGDFDAVLKAAKGPVLVDFWAPGCGACKAMGLILDRVAAKLAGRVTVVKVDVDRNPRIADRFRVESIPMFVLLDGKKRRTRVGWSPQREFEAWLDKAIG